MLDAFSSNPLKVRQRSKPKDKNKFVRENNYLEFGLIHNHHLATNSQRVFYLQNGDRN